MNPDKSKLQLKNSPRLTQYMKVLTELMYTHVSYALIPWI